MITASAQIAGFVRGVSDTASLSSLDSSASTHANFRSVLDQYHSSREDDSAADDISSVTQQQPKKKKESASTDTVAAPLPVTQTEPPRLLLPLAASIPWRHAEATLENSSAEAQDTTSPAETAPQSSHIAGIIREAPASASSASSTSSLNSAPAPVTNSRSALNRQHRSSNSNTESSARSKSLQQTKSVPAPDDTTRLPATPAAEPSLLALPITSSPLEPATTAHAVPDNDTAPAATADSKAPANTKRLNGGYQSHASREGYSEAVDTNNSGRPKQTVSDSNQVTAAPLPVLQTVEPSPVLRPLTASITLQQDGTALQSSSAASQNSTFAPETDPRTITPLPLERADDTAAAPPVGSLAFAARLSPNEETQPPVSSQAPAADSQSRAQTSPQLANPVATKQAVSGADVPAGGHGSDSGGQPEKEIASDRFAKFDALPPQTHVLVPDQNVIVTANTASANNHTSASTSSPMAHTDQVLDPPATAASTNHDITVRIPDASDQGTAVRFVERAGEVHVSVRTGDAEMAQNLRSGLNDLVNRLEDGGIRTEVWQPASASNTSTFQNDSHQPSADPDGSNGRDSSSDREPQPDKHNQPRWVEQLESSIGNPNFKETANLLWQA